MKPKYFKINFLLALQLIFVLMLTGSCSIFKKATPPDKVAAQFFHYFNNYEYGKAKELGTEKTQKTISFVEKIQTLGGADKIIMKDNKTDLLKTEIKGREAILTYRTYSGGEQKVYLVKKKGKWLVDLRKEATTKTPENQNTK
jgi:hypothetical protein